MRSNDELMSLIDTIIKEKNISYAELSRRTNTSKAALSRYKNKSREFPINKVGEFASAIGVSPEYLLGVEKNSNKNLYSLFNSLNSENQNKAIGFMEALKASQNK